MSPIQGILTMKNVSRNVCFLYVFIGCELKIFKDWWVLYLLVICLWRKCNSSLYLSEHTFNTCTKFFVKETLPEMFSWGFCENSKNTFSYRTPSGNCFFFQQHKNAINPFRTTSLFPYPVKTSANLWFSYVFKGYRKGPVA